MNKITNWTYDKPTEPGLYLACYGDVETLDNIACIRFFQYGMQLQTEDGLTPEDWGTEYKWASLLVGSEARQ